MDRLLSNKWTIAAFVAPALLIFLGVVIVPLFITGYYSLFDYNGLSKMEFAGVENYKRLFTNDPLFLQSLKNMSILIFGSVFVQIPIAFLIANKLAKGVPGEKAFRTIYFIPVVIAATIIGKLFYYIFSADVGMVNALVRALGVPDFHFNWLTNPGTAFLCVAFAAIWQYIGYHMLILYAGIKSISTDYFEAAMIDGATGAKATWHVTVPLLAPVIKVCVVLAAVGSVKTYDIVVSMVGSGTHSGTQVPAILLWRNLFKGRLVGYGSAQAFFLVSVCLIMSYLINRMFKKSEENASMS
ncbi:MAG: sugar ABC transporter permease [Clostridiales bacterium]|nr:sugar ABC transporter permease [Clostridiales bacterium]